MKTTVLTGLRFWSAWQPDRGIDFHSFWWHVGGDGPRIAIDPLPLPEPPPTDWIVVTNADHWRGTTEWRTATGASVVAPSAERDRLGDRATAVDAWVQPSDQLPDALADAFRAWPIEGGKSFEWALELRSLDALMFGDTVRSHVAGTLCTLPRQKWQDPERLLASLARIAGERPRPLRAILLGDGECFFRGAEEAWCEFAASLPDA